MLEYESFEYESRLDPSLRESSSPRKRPLPLRRSLQERSFGKSSGSRARAARTGLPAIHPEELSALERPPKRSQPRILLLRPREKERTGGEGGGEVAAARESEAAKEDPPSTLSLADRQSRAT